jgi:hypothetical protein
MAGILKESGTTQGANKRLGRIRRYGDGWMQYSVGGDWGGCVGCWPTIAAVVCSTVGRARRRDDEEASEEVKSCV